MVGQGEFAGTRDRPVGGVGEPERDGVRGGQHSGVGGVGRVEPAGALLGRGRIGQPMGRGGQRRGHLLRGPLGMQLAQQGRRRGGVRGRHAGAAATTVAAAGQGGQHLHPRCGQLRLRLVEPPGATRAEVGELIRGVHHGDVHRDRSGGQLSTDRLRAGTRDRARATRRSSRPSSSPVRKASHRGSRARQGLVWSASGTTPVLRLIEQRRRGAAFARPAAPAQRPAPRPTMSTALPVTSTSS